MKKLLLALLAALLAVALPAAAMERATPEDAEDLARTAAAYIKKNGRDKAFAAFNDKGSQFFKQDLYVFAYDLKGNCLALPTKPERVGKNWNDLKDPDGKFILRDFIEVAKSKGTGWSHYKFDNPASGKVEPKVSFIIKIDDYLIGVGAYEKK